MLNSIRIIFAMYIKSFLTRPIFNVGVILEREGKIPCNLANVFVTNAAIPTATTKFSDYIFFANFGVNNESIKQ